MTATTDPLLPDITDDSPGASVSIYVPDTSQDNPNSSFFRLGRADPDHEKILPADVTVPGTPGSAAASPYLTGALLYTTGQCEITAPKTYILSPSVIINATSLTDPPVSNGISTFSPNTLSAVLNGEQLCSASLTTNGEYASLFHNRPANVTFQNVDQLTITQGASSNFLTGDALTFWTGNDQSIGFGGLLWANMGFTSNIFGGTIINLTNTSAQIQGLGAFDATTEHAVSASTSIMLNVNPGMVATLAFAQRVTTIMNGIMALGTLVAGAYSGGVLTEFKDFTSHDVKGLTDRMTSTNRDLEIMTELIVGVQALSLVLAIYLQLVRRAPKVPTSELSLTNGACSIITGTSGMTMTPAGISLQADDPMSFISLMAGAALKLNCDQAVGLTCGPATRISMDPASLTLVAGPSSITLGPNGITMVGVQINNNALQAGFAPVLQPAQPMPPQLVIAEGEAEAQDVELWMQYYGGA